MTNPLPIRPGGSFIAFDKIEINGSIPERFERQVQVYSGRLAIQFGNHALTYADLNEAANRIAQALLYLSSRERETIALLIEQGGLLIAAILGILKAGRIYVPLDPQHPRSRLEYMLSDAEPTWILTHDTHLALADGLAPEGCRVLNVERLDASGIARNPSPQAGPDSLACLYYTSGSTGRPKGVVDSHRNVLHNIMRYTNGLSFSPEDRFSLIQSCGFSGCVSTMFGALLNGASVFPYDLQKAGSAGLSDWARQSGITIYHSVPALFRELACGTSQFPSVRLIRLEGDQASRKDVELYRRHFSPECLLVNGLGTTETGIVRRFVIDHRTTVPEGPLPVGYAVDDMIVLVLDEEGRPLVDCEIGEIAVQSEYLASGYWRRPDLTAACFRRDPENSRARIYRTGDLGRMRSDGCLEHLGRKDFHGKIRGQWVEIEAVESALLDMGAFKDIAVVTRQDPAEETRLVAYLVPATDLPPTVSALRRVLEQKLPRQSIPSSYVLLDALPLNEHRKLDRSALPPPERTRPCLSQPYEAPHTPLEQVVADIWVEVLQLDRVGIHDSFFDLGGDSLTAGRVLSRVRLSFSVELSLRQFFDAPTVHQMALEIQEVLVAPAIVPRAQGPQDTPPS